MSTNPTTFTLTDNGDGTATIYDGALAIVTIERDRGSDNSGSPNDTMYLKYVAQGVTYRHGGKYDDPTIHISCASRTTETEVLKSAAAWKVMQAEARRAYVTGYVDECRRNVARADYEDWTAERVVEMASSPEFAEHSGADLAAALLAEFGG